jgi:hypothetical protein
MSAIKTSATSAHLPTDWLNTPWDAEFEDLSSNPFDAPTDTSQFEEYPENPFADVTHNPFDEPPLTSKTRKLSPALSFLSTAALTIGASFCDYYLSPKIGALVARSEICLVKWLPTQSITIARNAILSAESKIITYIPGAKNFARSEIGTPVWEEIFFRGIIQHCLLKKIPQKIIETISPTHAKMVNSALSRIARVAVVALFFAAIHHDALNCNSKDLISHLIGGLLYGSLVDLNPANLVHTINLHFIFNILCEMSS